MALDTKKFVQGLIDNGYSHICAVPCSFATYLINETINNSNIEYISCSSEAVAVSIATGLKLSNKKPVVIAQSSGLTNMGSCITSLLKPYGITFPIIISWRTYKNGDSELQHEHLATNLPKLIEAYGYTHTILDSENLENAISQIGNSNEMKSICIIKKDSFSKIELEEKHKIDLSLYIKRSEFLQRLNSRFKNTTTIFVGTTGNTSREMYEYMKNTNNFYMAGNMGGALSLGFGIAQSGKKVVVCGGDAEFTMHLGGLATVGRYMQNIDVTYIVFDNEINKSTGGQNSYQQHLDYIQIAKNCGVQTYEKIVTTLEEFELALNLFETVKKIKFIHVKCGLDEEVVRSPLEVIKVNKL